MKMDDMISKGVGKAKGVKARMQGLKGIFKTLAEEHGEVSVLLKRASTTSDPEVRKELFPKIRKALLAHEQGEVHVLYTTLRQYDETRGLADHHDEEATELES